MTLTIELSDKHQAALKAQARAKGVSEAGFVQKVLEQILEPTVMPAEEREATMHQFQRSKAAAAARIREIQQRSRPDPEGWTVRDYINYGRP